MKLLRIKEEQGERKKELTLRMPKELYTQLGDVSLETGLSISSLIILAILRVCDFPL